MKVNLKLVSVWFLKQKNKYTAWVFDLIHALRYNPVNWLYLVLCKDDLVFCWSLRSVLLTLLEGVKAK